MATNVLPKNLLQLKSIRIIEDGTNKQWNKSEINNIKFEYPEAEFEEIPVIDRDDGQGFLAGAAKWLPLYMKSAETIHNKDLEDISEHIRLMSPCTIQLTTYCDNRHEFKQCWLMLPYNKKFLVNIKIFFREHNYIKKITADDIYIAYDLAKKY